MSPALRTLSETDESFLLNAGTTIEADEALQDAAGALSTLLEPYVGRALPLKAGRHSLVLRLDETLGEGLKPFQKEECYSLEVTADKVVLTAVTTLGAFHGVQTLAKALPALWQAGACAALPGGKVMDYPEYPYRAFMLDCGRHFFPVSTVKKVIDILALHQLNTFHWHLSEDQGWRLEIKRWPKLITIGAQRSGTIIGTNSDLDDHIPYGGYYTQEEARDIVAYAKERHITVVPEIDMPGHMLAALASYPELGCTGGPYEVGHYWGIYKDVLCVANERVYQFVEDVLTEVMDIFPSEVIHIGGDEAPTDKWQQCPKCQQLGAYQTFFTRRVFDFLTAHHRRALGWDEILDGSPQDAMIMSWRGTEPGAKAAALGHDVVMAPTTHCYFDYQQVEDALFEPSRCGGFIAVEKVYDLNPVLDSLSLEAKAHILGVQANLWTEYVTNEEMAEYQVLPRMSALAEVQWTLPARKDYDAFRQRLTRLTQLFERNGYVYAKHLWPERQIPNRWQF